MRELEANIVKVLIAAIAVAALYDVAKNPKGFVDLTSTGLKGFTGILARITGQTPPQGF